MDQRASLVGLDRAALKAALSDAGVPEKSAAMRASQVWNWLYVHGARDFAAMTNLAKDFRALLEGHFTLARPDVVTAQLSEDGTRKWLMRTGPGIEFETVYIPEEDRGTLCVSSQVGCTLTCKFCHTGTQKLVRNLTPAEIKAANDVPVGSLRDPQTLAERTKPDKENWLITMGVCTHLGCVPLGAGEGEVKGEFGGYFCPCHGSVYDTAARIRKGPAPKNLEVPEYAFTSDTVVKIG